MSSKAYNILTNEILTFLQGLSGEETFTETLTLEKSREKIYLHIADLYLKYSRCARQLEKCYDQSLHPQKRRLLRVLLDSTVGRVLELKHELVSIEALEYHPLTDLLLEAKILPSEVDVSAPRYFLRERTDEEKARDKMLKEIFDRHSAFQMDLSGSAGNFMTLEEAIRLIQVHERARQGKVRAALMRSVRAKEESQKGLAHLKRIPKYEPYQAAVVIQKLWRGFIARRKIKDQRKQEMIILGMLPASSTEDDVSVRERISQLESRRHKLQEGYEKDYQKAQIEIREKIEEQEGNAIKESLQEDIQLWYTQEWQETGKFPDFPNEEKGGSIAIFSPPQEEEKPPETKEVKVGKKASKDKLASRRNRFKAKTKEKKEVEPLFVFKPSNFLPSIQSAVKAYTESWGDKIDEDPHNMFDREVIEMSERPEVESQIRKVVDSTMRQDLEILKLASEKDKGKRAKKPKLTKKGKKVGKKGKGRKKDKDLTPDRTLESLAEELVQHEILKNPPHFTMTDFLCDYSYYRSPKDWTSLLPEPSLADVRRAVIEFCILPLGSPSVHIKAPLIRSVLLAGPRGTGKKSLVYSICAETGAALFDLSSANIAGKYPGKAGLSMLMHLVQKVAKKIQPAVIFIEEAEKTFLKKTPRADKTDPKRLKKDLPKLVKAIGIEDRILLCGITHAPFDCDIKALTACYQKIMYVPKPNYSSRRALWKELICKNKGIITPALTLGTLTKVSEGYSSASIFNVVQQVLNERRLTQLAKFPLTLSDFTNPLAQQEPIYRREEDAYRVWYGKTPLGKKRLRILKKIMRKSDAGDDDEDGEKEKAKKKKERKSKKKKT